MNLSSLTSYKFMITKLQWAHYNPTVFLRSNLLCLSNYSFKLHPPQTSIQLTSPLKLSNKPYLKYSYQTAFFELLSPINIKMPSKSLPSQKQAPATSLLPQCAILLLFNPSRTHSWKMCLSCYLHFLTSKTPSEALSSGCDLAMVTSVISTARSKQQFY